MRLREDEVKCRETEVDREEKNLKNIIKAEKDKRLHLEERITTRLEKTGVVVLEGGQVLATPQQISLHADLEVTSQQLRKALAVIMDEEAIVPPVACPPLIRSEFEVGPNPTAFRLSLDAERNQITRELEVEFVKNHPGGIFNGP